MNLRYLYVLICLIVFLTACSAPKEVLYLQDIATIKQEKIEKGYEVKIHKDDLLAIIVNSKDEELALPFNMPLVSYQIGSNYNQPRIVGYLVDQNGDIDFPVLGKMHVQGLTRMQLTELIKKKLSEGDLIKDPIVTVQFLNFKVSVIGEVSRPGTFEISGDRITLLEALSRAGDLTIHGRRDRVAVIREENGERIIRYHDLRSSDIFNSPCYYLQQNDIVYVEPNKARTGQSRVNSNNSASVWLSTASVLASIASQMDIVSFGRKIRDCKVSEALQFFSALSLTVFSF